MYKALPLMAPTSHYLVVDFDYFFKPDQANFQLYDWGHKETPLFITSIWPSRALGFKLARLPLPGLTGEQHTFWSRFNFTPRARCYYAESNVYAMHQTLLARYRPQSLWLYDAHHDGGYRRTLTQVSTRDSGSVKTG